MDLNELWIGDTVKLQSSGKIGTYIGTNSEGRPRVRCGTKVILTAANNIEVFHESEKQGEVDIELIEKPTVKNSAYLSREIDLHIENLNPSLTHEAPQMILNHQIKRCRTYNHQCSDIASYYRTWQRERSVEVGGRVSAIAI
jgi:predicted metallo-beta-lactamase superfamily hydrolase